MIIFETFFILSIEPTDVPPNFNTTIFIDQFFYLNKYVDKIHLNCNVNYQSLMSTVNKKEIDKFSKIANEWWDAEGKFTPLHKFNPLRIKYIKEKIINHFGINSKSFPLKNIELLDIGCGGGLLTEPMSRLGAKVTGIDASKKKYRCCNLSFKKRKIKN